jgi:hypothetical protein
MATPGDVPTNPQAPQTPAQNPVQAVRFVDFATYLQQDEATQQNRSQESKQQHQDRMNAHMETMERQQAESQARRVPQCDGTDPAAVREWMREVELTIPYTNRTNHVAAYSATGRLRRHLERFLSQQPDRNAVPWATLAKFLSATFLSPHEEDQLRNELNTLRRGPYETHTAFGMRFAELADLAYPAQTPSPQNPSVMIRIPDQDRILMDAYTAGLNDDDLVTRLLEEAHPATYEAAMFHVTQFESDRYRINMAKTRTQAIQRIEEPMEIGAIQGTANASAIANDPTIVNMDRKIAGLADQFTKMMAFMEKQQSQQSHNRPRQSPRPSQPRRSQRPPAAPAQQTTYTFTQEGRPICNYCAKIGHIAKECRSRMRNQRSAAIQGNH